MNIIMIAAVLIALSNIIASLIIANSLGDICKAIYVDTCIKNNMSPKEFEEVVSNENLRKL